MTERPNIPPGTPAALERFIEQFQAANEAREDALRLAAAELEVARRESDAAVARVARAEAVYRAAEHRAFDVSISLLDALHELDERQLARAAEALGQAKLGGCNEAVGAAERAHGKAIEAERASRAELKKARAAAQAATAGKLQGAKR